jgi:glycerol-3-phosphate dehydrogenase
LKVILFSKHTRAQNRLRLEEEVLDLLILGGGVTGAAIARDAALRGMQVGLLESHDFASGTSSKSSKLIHGGLRYLEQLEFGLVFESLKESAWLLENAPRLVRPIKFFFPTYKGRHPSRWLLKIGMLFYDTLALRSISKAHRALDKKTLLSLIPDLHAEGLEGAFSYLDATMWDDTLVMEFLHRAHECGASLMHYAEIEKPLFENQQCVGFQVRDKLESWTFNVKARSIIVATGPWTDHTLSHIDPHWQPLLKGSQGTHLIFPLSHLPLPGVVVMPHPKDGRISFLMPRPDIGPGILYVGTTDAAAPQNPRASTATDEEIDYLLNLLRLYFPTKTWDRSLLLSTVSGIRPLLNQNHASLAKQSREHVIFQGPGDVTVIAGGKYTTARKMAEQAVDFILEAYPRRADLIKGFHWDHPEDFLRHRSMDAPLEEPSARLPQISEPLYRRYGTRAEQVLREERRLQHMLETEHPDVFARFHPFRYPEGFQALLGQASVCIETEMCVHLEDFFSRRTALLLTTKQEGLAWALPLSYVFAQLLGWSEDEREAECQTIRLSN